MSDGWGVHARVFRAIMSKLQKPPSRFISASSQMEPNEFNVFWTLGSCCAAAPGWLVMVQYILTFGGCGTKESIRKHCEAVFTVGLLYRLAVDQG